MAQALHLTRLEKRRDTRPPARRQLEVLPAFLAPRGLSLRNAWLHGYLFVVAFLAERLTARRDALLVQWQMEMNSLSRKQPAASQQASAGLGMLSPPQPQPVALKIR